jgi:hypothetical protein
VGRSVFRDNDSRNDFYRLEGGHERGQEGMRSTMMVDLQCIDIRVEVGTGGRA